MKKTLRIAVVAVALGFMVMPDLINAQYGIRRRTARRTAVVVGSAAKSAGAAQASAAQQQTAAAQQQATASQQQAAAAEQQAAAAQQQAVDAEQRAAAAEKEAAIAKQDLALAQGVLPLGTVVRTRPQNCTTTAVGGVEYYKCGVNYYRAVFEGNNLVYVTAQPKQ